MNLDAIRTQLTQRLTTLTTRAGKIERDLRQPHDDDSEERATETENDEVLEGLDDLTLTEVRQIREALRRLDDGTYGTCATCGKPIGAARLASLPSTPLCVACAA